MWNFENFWKLCNFEEKTQSFMELQGISAQIASKSVFFEQNALNSALQRMVIAEKHKNVTKKSKFCGITR